MSPRPILKCLPATEHKLTRPSFRVGRVHFPPTPEISATYFAHSPRSYDRSAIVVSPNDCALPQRNCPDRTYVLSEGKGEGRLLKSVESKGMDMDDEDVDDTPSAPRDQIASNTDYFSIPPSMPPEMTWSESDESDGLMSPPNEIDSNPGHPPIPMLNIPIPDASPSLKVSPSPEHVQAALAFLPHALPPAIERKRSLSPSDYERKDRAHSFSGSESSCVSPHRRPRRASSFIPDVPPDSGCLGGF